MRTGRLLHPELARALALLGHGDIVLVTDAGAPIPPDLPRVDLALAPGLVDVRDVLRVLRAEIFVEDVVLARELQDGNPLGIVRREAS